MYSDIPCIYNIVCFDDAIHGRRATYFGICQEFVVGSRDDLDSINKGLLIALELTLYQPDPDL